MDHGSVQDYYGKTLQGSDDLQTDACCTVGEMPARVKAILSNIHDEVLARYYGCGLIAPEGLKGARVLDLGCGAGRDVYALAQLVGPEGEVVGVDMTEEQLEVARRRQDWHAEKFGYPNTRFLHGYLEKLDELDLEPGSFDVIVSNCVINLCMDKRAALAGARRLLKPGGEMHFSDVYADRRMSEELLKDPVLWGECLSGALYWGDFLALCRDVGFDDPRALEGRPLAVSNPKLEEKLGEARFASVTMRLFAAEGLEPGAESYGQTASYYGGLDGAEEALRLDDSTLFPVDVPIAISGNTAAILAQSRFAPNFEITPPLPHRGAFPEAPAYQPFGAPGEGAAAGSCCAPAEAPAAAASSCCGPAAEPAKGGCC
ncbi:methyltransferase domain-containing protein [Rhodovulum sp. DZ06]|uniref:methyltransferase domain-containing protein n=1 Tax=Rhodovulum sp. DZ06 TaxID=3425126 RepID=UPI003D33865E